jgi:peptide/nickel transport system substrate-binding protein
MGRKLLLVLVFLALLGLLPVACSTATSTSATSPTISKAPQTTTAAAPTTTTVAAATTTSASSIVSLLQPGEKPQTGGVFRFGTPAQPTKLVTWNQGYDGRFLKASYDTLFRIDENGNLQPWLATGYKVADDLKSMTITLRQGVKFHDGTDFNAKAAKWNIELRRDSKMGNYGNVTSIDVVDDYTIRLNLSSFSNTLYPSFWHIAGMMHSPTAYEKDGKDKALWNPVGTGPFTFVSYQKDVKVTYTRNDNYWRGKPYLDGYECVFVSDPTALEMGLRTGQFDTAEQVTNQQFVGLEKDGYKVVKGVNMPTEDAAMPDSANPDSPFAKLKVRQAILYAVDLPNICKNLSYDYTTPLYSIAAKGNYAYVPGIEYKYDPARAKQLLNEAGYPNGFDATFVLTTKDFNDVRQAWNGYLADIGIKVKVNVVDMAGMYAANQNGWYNGFTDKNMAGSDWLTQINYQLAKDAIYRKSWAQPAGLQDLLDKAMATPDLSVRNKYCQDIVKLIDAEASLIPTWDNPSKYPLTINRKVHNAEYVLWGPNKLWTPADVWIEK